MLLTIPACEVQAGDKICNEIIMSSTQESSGVTILAMSGLRKPARVPSEWPLTVVRLIDECPRGRMKWPAEYTLTINGVTVLDADWNDHIKPKLVQLWNDDEDARNKEGGGS